MVILRNNSPLEEMKSKITCVEPEKVSKLRSRSRSIQPSKNATGCSSKCICVKLRKLLNKVLKYDSNFAKNIKAMNRNKLENIMSMCVHCYIQCKAELPCKFY